MSKRIPPCADGARHMWFIEQGTKHRHCPFCLVHLTRREDAHQQEHPFRVAA